MPKYGHYTSKKGLMGIINSNTVWATNIKFLNDEHEFFHAIKMIREKLSNPKMKTTDPDFEKIKTFISKIEKNIDKLNLYKVDTIYTFSLSAEIDLLSQWRGYCPDNNGFCIEFDIDQVFESAIQKYEEVYQLDCVYQNQEAQITELINTYWHKYHKEKISNKKNDILKELTKEIILLASHYKHQSFSEEKERRIVIILKNVAEEDLKFRDGKSAIVPYVEIPIKTEFIKKIWIGPTLNKELAKRGLELFLEKTCDDFLSSPSTEFSKIPYRPI